MIKLKNLWKIALAAMTMSAMLVACEEPSKGGSDTNEDTNKVVLAEGGEGVYSYTVNIADISGAWGGNSTSPTFSVVLLTDEGLAKCVAEKNFKVNPATAPEYQIGAFGNMKIKDTTEDGTFKVYGATSVEDVYQYYNGVAVVVDATTVTLTVDMTKIAVTDLKALWEGESEAAMTAEDIVELNGYKPYVVALATAANDEANCKFNAWSADVMAMAAGATFPTGAVGNAPVVPTCKDLNSVAGTINGWTHAALTDNAVTFTAAGGDEFAFTVGSWDFKACGAVVDALDKEIKLAEAADANITFAEGVLTAGTEYTATLIVKGNHEAYVKVSAK